ncbi:CBU_0592 family membrane protein [Parapedobacter flavus]|uniref:CBU_0592 family membrane protein n=1 Tax=Parapedobacter flavus TaxID=3110225 RepID=UPI003F514B5F
MTETTVTIIGWLGFIFCSLAYLLLNLKILRFDNPLYQILNVIGGVGLVISAWYFKDSPNLAANGIWVLIALFGIIRYSRQRSSMRRRDGQVVKPE